MSHKTIALTALAAAAVSLAACNTEPETIVVGGPADEPAPDFGNRPVPQLPPPVKASKTFRCKDNSLVYVDFFADDKGANIRTEKNGPPVMVAAPEPGQEMVSADGTAKLSGDTAAITVTLPDLGTRSCKS